MTIYMSNSQFIISTENGRLHILNKKSFGWHLKYVMELDLSKRKWILNTLLDQGCIRLEWAS